MRILYVVHDFLPRYFGGTERYVLGLAQQMQQMGHRADVLTYALGEPVSALEESAGEMLLHSYTFEGVSVVAIRHRDQPATLGHAVLDAQVEAAVGAVIARADYDIVHMAHPMRLAASWRAVKRHKLPLVLTLTDFWLLCPRTRFFKPDHSYCASPDGGEKCVLECGYEPQIRDRYRDARSLFDGADAVIAPSDLLIDTFRRCGWHRAITKIRHGVARPKATSAAARRSGDARLRIGYTGIVARFKGADLLLRAFAATNARNLLLKIYGSVIWDNELRYDLETAYGSCANIHLLNRYDSGDLPEVMATVDITVVPSTTLESYGLVVAESLAYGVPVVASDMVGSAHELIEDGRNGLIFASGDQSALRRVFERLSTEPELVTQLRANVSLPPLIEEEAFQVEQVYRSVL